MTVFLSIALAEYCIQYGIADATGSFKLHPMKTKKTLQFGLDLSVSPARSVRISIHKKRFLCESLPSDTLSTASVLSRWPRRPRRLIVGVSCGLLRHQEVALHSPLTAREMHAYVLENLTEWFSQPQETLWFDWHTFSRGTPGAPSRFIRIYALTKDDFSEKFASFETRQLVPSAIEPNIIAAARLISLCLPEHTQHPVGILIRDNLCTCLAILHHRELIYLNTLKDATSHNTQVLLHTFEQSFPAISLRSLYVFGNLADSHATQDTLLSNNVFKLSSHTDPLSLIAVGHGLSGLIK